MGRTILIRLLLSRFSEDEGTVRRMVATDPSFDALCHDYRKVIDRLDRFEFGGLIAGWLLPMIGIFNIGGIIGAIIYSVIGAMILLLIVPFFKP